MLRLHGEKVCYRELGFEGEQRLLAKLKYRTVQRKKQVYNTIASQVYLRNKIPESLVINSDQTPSKYVQVGRFTMVSKGAKKVGVAGIADKRNIMLTLTVTMDGKALPFQAIYKGKTKQSLPKVTFPTGFSLSANMKHHSNTQEVLKHLKKLSFHIERKKMEILINLDF